MNLALKVLLRARVYRAHVRSEWNRKSFLLLESGFHRQCVVHKTTIFNVPLRSGGRGVLVIGCKNVLGFTEAPRIGNGEILIQPRSERAEILIGDNNKTSNNISIIANERVTIGNDCQIGDFVSIFDSDFHELNPSSRIASDGLVSPVNIGNNVWLGSRVMVLKGVSIGENSVIGAGSIVTKSLPSNVVAAGVPARIVRALK